MFIPRSYNIIFNMTLTGWVLIGLKLSEMAAGAGLFLFGLKLIS